MIRTSTSICGHWAHPRRCGEHPTTADPARRTCGLIPAGAGNMSAVRACLCAARAHPRRCGEHSSEPVQAHECEGSSPQVRGTYGDRVLGGAHGGLIPAGAGNIVGDVRVPGADEAHPRRCGEHSGSAGSLRRTSGSSPQVRGTSVREDAQRRVGGAHPRRCGEHIDWLHVFDAGLGSSPQVRGTFTSLTQAAATLRLIPAGAGNIG